MGTCVRNGARLVMLQFFLCATPAWAQHTIPRAVMTVPTAGTFARGGEFKGTISINRFERRGNDIVAVGIVAGVLSRGSHTVGTGVAGEISWAVRVSVGGVAVANTGDATRATLSRIAWSTDRAQEPRVLQVQAAGCPVLNVVLAPTNVDLLGLQVALSGVALDLGGAEGTPLGDLVCAASDLIGNVVGLVNLLNAILSLVTGLLGGLAGGLGGAVPLP